MTHLSADETAVTTTAVRVGDPLRVSDLVPLRRVLGSDSLVIRVHPDGTFTPFEQMPSLFFTRSIRRAISADRSDEFEAACNEALRSRQALAFRPRGTTATDEVMITPIVDDDGIECRFLVCWARNATTVENQAPVGAGERLTWDQLRLDDVATRIRNVEHDGKVTIEAAPWWLVDGRLPIELWPHHEYVSALGIGHAVMETVILDACETAATQPAGPQVRVDVPSADMLLGLIPVFHGALRATGTAPERIVVAIPAALAVDQDLLPIIVHLRTMGLMIDIIGLEALTATLHMVNTASRLTPPAGASTDRLAGPWRDIAAE